MDALNEVYYRIFLSPYIRNKLTVLTMQDFDEKDYLYSNFFKDKNGEILKFNDENEAVKWLFDNIKEEKIDPEYIARFPEFRESWQEDYYK